MVLPEPDTPVTTVSRPLGISTFKGFTVWMAAVERCILPSANSSPAQTRSLTWISAVPARNGPIWDALFWAISGIVPWATTRPPLAPALGPISISQSAWDKI